jgi:hypothetical protein
VPVVDGDRGSGARAALRAGQQRLLRCPAAMRVIERTGRYSVVCRGRCSVRTFALLTGLRVMPAALEPYACEGLLGELRRTVCGLDRGRAERSNVCERASRSSVAHGHEAMPKCVRHVREIRAWSRPVRDPVGSHDRADRAAANVRREAHPPPGTLSDLSRPYIRPVCVPGGMLWGAANARALPPRAQAPSPTNVRRVRWVRAQSAGGRFRSAQAGAS